MLKNENGPFSLGSLQKLAQDFLCNEIPSYHTATKLCSTVITKSMGMNECHNADSQQKKLHNES